MTSAISGMGGAYRPQVVSGASMRRPPAQRMADLFDKIDTSGSGTITKAQFEQAFQNLNPPKRLQAIGADSIFNQLDPSGIGSVSKQDFVGGMTTLLAQLRGGQGHHRADGDADDGATSSDTSAPDLVAALRNLEETLGGKPSPGQGVAVGTLFNLKA